jgi:hypothetical protein
MLYSEDDITIVGIIQDEDIFKSSTNSDELKKVIYDSLSIGPMFDPLMKDLEEKNLIILGDINCEDLIKALYSNSFL